MRFHIELPRRDLVIVDIVAARASAVRAVLVRSVDGYGAERTRADMLFLVVVIDPFADLVLMHEITASALAVGVKRMLFFHIDVTKIAPTPMLLFVAVFPYRYGMLVLEITANTCAVISVLVVLLHIRCTELASSPVGGFVICPIGYGVLAGLFLAANTVARAEIVVFLH